MRRVDMMQNTAAAAMPGERCAGYAPSCCSSSMMPPVWSWSRFRPAEDPRRYFRLVQQLNRRYGLSPALQLDRHAVFRPAGPQPELPEATTQFSRAKREPGSIRYPRSLTAKPRAVSSASPAPLRNDW